MKKIDSLGIKLCKYQAELFRSSAFMTECSSQIFIRRFMNSEVAKRLDSSGIIFEAVDIADAIKEIEMQYGVSKYGSKKYDSYELYWMGYICRYWVYTSEKSSKQIYKIIKPDQLRKMYFPYHSLDPAQAIERIEETLTPKSFASMGDIARGVEILRRVRNKDRQ